MRGNIDEILAQSQNKDAKELEEKTSFKKKEDKHFHWVRIGFIWVFSGILLIIAIVMAWHFVAPTEYRWLSEAEIIELKNMATTGVLGVVLGKFGTKLAE